MDELIKVLIADDHAVIRVGLSNILKNESDITVVGEAKDGLEAINKALELKPDVILMDIFMPHLSGLDATIAINEILPDIKVIIITISEQEDDLFKALKLGAYGYLLKNSSTQQVVEAVRQAVLGQIMLSPIIATKIISEFRNKTNEPMLSPREMEVLQLMGKGLTNTLISDHLFISESTVRTYIRRVLEKLHLRNRAEAIVYATRHHLI